MFEVADVEHRDAELDVGIVSDAVYGALAAGFAERAFVGGTLCSSSISARLGRNKEATHQSPIENAILHW